VKRANQEHGIIDLGPSVPARDWKIGDLVRVAPNHICMTSATMTATSSSTARTR
jgi:D-serine deaminase-like pyridoxal phosphate-dependent protein